MERTCTKGWICLDIDGTITADILSIPNEVLAYLEGLAKRHWKLVFVTGRTFSLAAAPLKNFSAPFLLVPQNGASAFQMPEQKMLLKKYLSCATFINLEKKIHALGHDFVLFGGIDQNEPCFYRPSFLKKEVRDYFNQQLTRLACHWEVVDSFNDLPIQEIPYGKIYGKKEELQLLLPIFEKEPNLHAHLVIDSVNPQFSIIQIMRNDVNKGQAVLELMTSDVLPTPIISAGNDTNDESLLQIADVKIAMPDSPQALLDQATIVAPSVHKMGIIPALEEAFLMVGGK